MVNYLPMDMRDDSCVINIMTHPMNGVYSLLEVDL